MNQSHADQPLYHQRLEIFERIVFVLALAFIPILLIVIYAGFSRGWTPLTVAQVGLISIIIGAHLCRKVVTAKNRLLVITTIFLIAAATELYRYGFTAAPMYLMTVVPILASTSFGLRYGFLALALILAILVFFGVATIAEGRVPPGSFPDFFFEPKEWIVRLINLTIATSIGIYVTGRLFSFHETSTLSLEEKYDELESSLSRNHQATEIAKLGYAVTDEKNDCFIECDEAFASMHGMTVEEMMKVNILTDIIEKMIQPSDQEQARINKHRLDQGEAVISEFGHKLGNGEVRHIRKIFTPRNSKRGVGHFVEIVGQDVSESYELREQLFQSQKLEAIGNLTGGVAHDFNNLLAIILGNLETLEEEVISGSVSQDSLPIIEASIAATIRGSDLTKNMLAFARRSRLEAGVFQLNDVVRRAEVWISRTLPSNINVETTLSAGLWKVHADQSTSESALLNLLLNAQQAMPDGGKLTIETSNVTVDGDYIGSRSEDIAAGRYVMLAVSDTGHGIEHKDLEKVFDPFFTTKAPGEGTGLGLSMVLGFMKQSGGTARVYSEVGQGTTLKLYFQAASGRETADLAPSKARQPVSKGQRCILVAEDEPDVLSVIVTALKKSGFHVISTGTGDEALAVFIENLDNVDLLLTDIVMPGDLLGTALAREVRTRKPELPVVFMSGYANEATVHGNGLRPEDIRLMKPIRRSDLIKAIHESLNMAQNGNETIN